MWPEGCAVQCKFTIKQLAGFDEQLQESADDDANLAHIPTSGSVSIIFMNPDNFADICTACYDNFSVIISHTTCMHSVMSMVMIWPTNSPSCPVN